MDNSHVALVSMNLSHEGFSPYRCDRNIALGINLNSLTKVLRAAQNEDILTLKAADSPDSLNLVFENTERDRSSEYDIKLMDIDQEHLGIPDTDYSATVVLPSAEFQRICRDLSQLSESGKQSLNSKLRRMSLTNNHQLLSKPRRIASNSRAAVISETDRLTSANIRISRDRNNRPASNW